MSNQELDALILRNLPDLEATAQRIDQIDAAVWQAVDRLVEDWVSEQDGWSGNFDVGRGRLWVAPGKWLSGSDNPEDPAARFKFDFTTQDPICEFDLSDLCGLGGSRYGFRFDQHLLDNGEWKEIARGQAAAFAALGMHLDNKASAFAEVVISPDKLAAAVESGDYGEALAPLTAVLDRLLEADKKLGRSLFKAGTAASRKQPKKTPSRKAASKKPRRRR